LERLSGGAQLEKKVIEQESEREEVLQQIEHLLPLFWVDKKDRVNVLTADSSITFNSGGTIIGLAKNGMHCTVPAEQ
jgi:hypothetical protein